MYWKSAFFLFLIKAYTVESVKTCRDFDNCAECIGFPRDNCVWCNSDIYEGFPCQSKSFHDRQHCWCKGSVYNPIAVQSTVQSENFNFGKNVKKVVQFKPQIVNIKARPGEPVSVTMDFKLLASYPLDVYYIIDYSNSMAKHIRDLKTVGAELYDQLSKISDNVRMGIGSFVMENEQTNNTYIFKNHLSLTANMSLFEEALGESPVNSTLIQTEGALYALTQAMLCRDVIGWRKDARRIVILGTDDTNYNDEQTKLISTSRPFDMKCHLINDSYATLLDYASLNQINKIAVETNTKIIFSIFDSSTSKYEIIANNIQGAKYVTLKTMSDTVDFMKNELLNITRTVQLDYDIPPFIQLTMTPDCRVNNNECESNQDGIVKVTATIILKSCPKGNILKHFVKIGPMGLDEKVLIQFESDCKCNCDTIVLNATSCNYNGHLECGVCRCFPNRYGINCQCDDSNVDSTDLDMCKENYFDNFVCNGQGTCKCGQCVQCEKGHSGSYCHLNDNECERPGGKLCADHGRCSFGRCECEDQWTGEDCRCPSHDRDCFAPYSGQICSGNGECVCGHCVCRSTANETCSGKFCESCDDLLTKRCSDLKHTALCNYYGKTKSDCEKEREHNTAVSDVLIVNKSAMKSPEWRLAKWCKEDVNGWNIVFRYDYPLATNKLRLIIQNELEKIQYAPILKTIAVAMGAIILIGLLVVLGWKIMIDRYDKSLYKKYVFGDVPSETNVVSLGTFEGVSMTESSMIDENMSDISNDISNE